MAGLFDVLNRVIQQPDFPEGEFWHIERVSTDKEIIAQGEQSTTFYMILKGKVRVMGRVMLDGDKKVSPGVCDLGENEVFGELVLFDQAPRSATVKALEATELVAIDSAALKRYFDINQEHGYEFLRELTGVLVERLRHSNEKVFSLLAWGLKAHGIEQHL